MSLTKASFAYSWKSGLGILKVKNPNFQGMQRPIIPIGYKLLPVWAYENKVGILKLFINKLTLFVIQPKNNANCASFHALQFDFFANDTWDLKFAQFFSK